MKNFIFKSEADFHKIVFNKLETILAEQRHQRMDLAVITRIINIDINNRKLQTTVDEFYNRPTVDLGEEDDNHNNQSNPENS